MAAARCGLAELRIAREAGGDGSRERRWGVIEPFPGSVEASPALYRGVVAKRREERVLPLALGHGCGLSAGALFVNQGAALVGATADFEAGSWRGGGEMAGEAVASVFVGCAVGAANGFRVRTGAKELLEGTMPSVGNAKAASGSPVAAGSINVLEGIRMPYWSQSLTRICKTRVRNYSLVMGFGCMTHLIPGETRKTGPLGH